MTILGFLVPHPPPVITVFVTQEEGSALSVVEYVLYPTWECCTYSLLVLSVLKQRKSFLHHCQHILLIWLCDNTGNKNCSEPKLAAGRSHIRQGIGSALSSETLSASAQHCQSSQFWNKETLSCITDSIYGWFDFVWQDLPYCSEPKKNWQQGEVTSGRARIRQKYQ